MSEPLTLFSAFARRPSGMVRWIMLVNAIVYFASLIVVEALPPSQIRTVFDNLWLTHLNVFGEWKLWTLGSYGWFHEIAPSPFMAIGVCAAAIWLVFVMYRSEWAAREPQLFLIGIILLMSLIGGSREYGGPMHLVGNMLGLWLFGPRFEERWGSRRFLTFWFACAFGGGLLWAAVSMISPALTGDAVIGASGSVLGLLAAYSVYDAERVVLYSLIIPIKGKYVVWVALAFDAVSSFSGGSVSFWVHAGGALTGFLLVTGYWRPSKLMKRFGGTRPPRGGAGPTKKAKPSHLRLVKPDDDDPPRYLH